MTTLPSPAAEAFRATRAVHTLKQSFPLHLIRMHNPRVLGKAARPVTTVQLLRRHHLLQHLVIVNRTGPNHP
jgi:hypothetical protein